MSFEPYLRFYLDKDLTTEVSTLKFQGITLTGTSKILDIWVQNVSKYELINISVLILDSDVTTEPTMIPLLLTNQVAKLTFTFKPSIGRTEPLNTQFRVECVMIKRV